MHSANGYKRMLLNGARCHTVSEVGSLLPYVPILICHFDGFNSLSSNIVNDCYVKVLI